MTETLNTIFAGGTFAVIAVTAIAAVVQLRHLRTSNQLAAFSKYGLVMESSLMDTAVGPLLTSYIAVQPLIEYLRNASSDRGLYENFEYVATKCVLWLRAYPNGNYPKNCPRFSDVYPRPRS